MFGNTHVTRSNAGIIISYPEGRMLRSFGDRSFSVAAPTLWDALPASLRKISSLFIFKSQVKTYLFKIAFDL